MERNYHRKFKHLEKVQKQQGTQLDRIEKYLNNHLAHHEIDVNKWLKVWIPVIVVVVAPFAQELAKLVYHYFKALVF